MKKDKIQMTVVWPKKDTSEKRINIQFAENRSDMNTVIKEAREGGAEKVEIIIIFK